MLHLSVNPFLDELLCGVIVLEGLGPLLFGFLLPPESNCTKLVRNDTKIDYYLFICIRYIFVKRGVLSLGRKNRINNGCHT